MKFIENIIKSIVNEKQGCKYTELVTILACKLYDKSKYSENFKDLDSKLELMIFLSSNTGNELIIEIINKMINDKELVEVSYILESLNYKEKSIIFPKNTLIL